MESQVFEEEFTQEKIKEILVPSYKHIESGMHLTLHDMKLYLLNQVDFAIDPRNFNPETHEHSIPKYEMARIYLMVCALTGGNLGFRPEERGDPIYEIYEQAFRRSIRAESDIGLRRKLVRVASQCGFELESMNPLPS